jgi:hypothetical protein
MFADVAVELRRLQQQLRRHRLRNHSPPNQIPHRQSRPPKPTPAELQLKRENDGLKTTIVYLRRDLTDKEGHVGRLEFLLVERMNRTDELNGKLDQLRDQNRRLDAEAERLAEMVRLTAESF